MSRASAAFHLGGTLAPDIGVSRANSLISVIVTFLWAAAAQSLPAQWLPGPAARFAAIRGYVGEMVPRGGLSLSPFNTSKINYLTPPQMSALYQENVPMSTVK
jgi:hypothetical protein